MNKTKTEKILAWHFSKTKKTEHDAKQIRLGRKLTVTGTINPCLHGLHGSPMVLDACRYAPGPILWRVELSGTVVPHGEPVDKYAASERTAIAGGKDATPLLRAFARQCAADVLHLWDAPEAVKQYLLTGNESLRAAAGAAWAAAGAAWAAAGDAAGDARDAAWAAWDAAGDAAWAAAKVRLDEWAIRWLEGDGVIPTVTISEESKK